ncbi:zinc finger, C2H2 [Tanacetum coccineum]|uniref:Zinc finger, C2H2 n=1 Tax=Tanacetum coccineum TaxID=301880 RepID=A0ABQ5D5P0_9ASTR
MFPWRSEGEESEYPFFEGDGSSSDEWRDYDMACDDYEGPPVFDDDQYEEDKIKDVVVVANDICSSMIQTTLNVDFEKDINTKSHELVSFEKSIIIKVSQCAVGIFARRNYWLTEIFGHSLAGIYVEPAALPESSMDYKMGHEGHGVHLCRRCGWPYPNPHPSAKHRRSHKKHCGTIEGYTVLAGAEAVSDEDHHVDTDKEKSPSPKIEKKMSIGGSDGGDGLRASISRSEDEFFSDAVTEFSDSGPSQGGSVKKTLDKDLFYSFNDAQNAGTNEVLNAPIEVSKVDASLEVTEKLVTDVEKIGETEITTLPALSESKLELTETDEKCADGLVKDGAVDPTPEPIHVSQSQEAETIEAVKAAEENVEGSQTSEIINQEAKDSEVTKTTPDLIVGQDDDNIKQEVCEKIESEAVKESEVNNANIELDHEVAPEVVKESEIEPTVEGVVDEIKIESGRELVPEEVSETDKKVPVSIEKEDLGEHIQEVVNKLDTVLTEKSDVDAPESVKCSEEQIQEVVKELGTVLNEKENPDAAEFVKFLKDQVHDAVKEPETVVTEKENLEEPKLEKQSNECSQEVLVDPDSIWTEKTDLDAPIVEKSLKESTPEETVLKSDSVLTEKEDLDGPQLEKCAKEHTHEVIEKKADNESNVVGLVADVTVEKITPNASGVAPEQMSVDSSNSLDGNWGSGTFFVSFIVKLYVL